MSSASSATGDLLPAPNRKNTTQVPQKNIDDFWTAFRTKNPGQVYAVLPQRKDASEKRKREPQALAQSVPTSGSYQTAVRECKAVVDKISKECRRVNQRYRDLHFDMEFDLKLGKRDCLDTLTSPGWSSLLPKSVKRVGQIFEKPEFFVDGATSNDIRQGNDGDCWFLSGLSACIHKPDFMDSVCVARDEYVGVYGFVFHRDGAWFHIVVDDRLYLTAADYDESYEEKIAMLQLVNNENEEEAYRRFYQTGSKALYFAQCSSEHETWLPLIEKAYAKAHGDYGCIEGGWTGEAIEDLTGGVTTEIWTSDILDEEKFWEELLQVNKNFLFGCATGWSDDFMGAGGMTDRKDIWSGHAYSIMEARELKGKKLLKLRNPWGKSEWKGAWSDGSSEWTPEWMQLLDHRFGDDGIFWISYKDLLKKYSHFDRTRLFHEGDWQVCQQWVSLDIDWATQYHDTKFQIEVKEPGQYVIVLSQLDDRYFQGLQGQYGFQLRFRLEKDGEEGYIVRSNANYFMSRSCSVELILEPGVYSVIMKIDATRDKSAETPEQVIRRLHHGRRDKILKIGLAYDLAHAKGVWYETEEERALRKERARREREAAKADKKQAKRKELWENWDRRRRNRERKKRYDARLEEHKRKKAEAKKAEKEEAVAKPDAEAVSKDEKKEEKSLLEPASAEKASETALLAEAAANTEAPAPGDSPADSEERKRAESDDQKFEVISAPDASAASSDTRSEAGNPETAATEQNSDKAAKAVDVPQITVDAPQAQVTDSAAPAAREDSDSDTETVISWATSVDSKLDLDINDISDDDSDSDAASIGGGSQIDDDNKPFAEDAWNAVCVVGLRVYSREKVSIKVVRPRPEGLSLDVDDVSKAMVGDSPVADQAEVAKASADGQRPPLQERHSFKVMSSRAKFPYRRRP